MDLPVTDENVRIIRVKFDPSKHEFSDIFANEQACALWSLYRDGHIISYDGLVYLNKVCRILIKKKREFTDKTAQIFLQELVDILSVIERSRNNNEFEWINKTIPFLTGAKKVKLEMVSLS